MVHKSVVRLILNIILAVSVHYTLQCPNDEMEDAKAAHKSGEITDQTSLVTMDKIRSKLRDSGVFDWQDPSLSDRETKELGKLFNAVEIMTTSRNRQPSNVQNMFSSLRLVERVVKKQLKEGQISETLASKFNWDKLSTRQRRSKPLYYVDKATNMRIFDTNS